MGEYVSMIVGNARRTHGYAEKLMVGIDPGLAARKPRFESGGGVKMVDTNHPTFVYGHLSIYPAQLLAMIDGDVSSAKVPQGWDELFKAGLECRDDAAGTIYPAWGDVTTQYVRAYTAIINAVEKLGDARLLMQNPNPARREAFPTVGSLLLFLLNNHVMMHMGQVSAWRRCHGLPSVM